MSGTSHEIFRGNAKAEEKMIYEVVE